MMSLRVLILALLSGVALSEAQTIPEAFTESFTQTEPEWNSTTRVSPVGPSLERILDLFSPWKLARKWSGSFGESFDFGRDCRRNLDDYFRSLENNTLWALKMADASGRYGGGFFWGNAYWLGSSTLCSNIEPPPPFQLAFYVLKAQIRLTPEITPYTRSELLGVCLPSSCGAQEVENLVVSSVKDIPALEEYSSGDDGPAIQISMVKGPHTAYYMTEDPVFWILVVASAFVFLLVLVGTIFDLYREWWLSKCKKVGGNFDYANYAFAMSPGTDPHKQPQVAGEQAQQDGSPVTPVKVRISDNNNESGSEVSVEENSERNSVSSDETDTKQLSVWAEIILSFSARRNLLTICDKSVGADTIPTIHGLRSISMGWVILGHTCIIAFKYSDNMSYRKLMEKEFLFQTINNGAYSVDTFFFISGLLVSFLYFRTTAKHDINKITKSTGLTSNFIEFIGMIVYRFCRLTTPYFFILGVVQVAMKWFHYNSVFEAPATDYINCPKYWWRNLLYINTFFPVKDMCMLWSWYLADDTQFYILGAVLLIMAVRYFWASFSLFAVFLLSSWCTTAFIAFSHNHIPNEDDPLALFDKIYDKPWTRLGPYLIGMAVGWILFKTDCKIKMTKLTVVIGWTASITLLLFMVYGLFGSRIGPVSGAAFSSLSHTAWALGLAWIVIACSTGYGGYVNKILSWSMLYPFSRVTYCAYLVHPIAIRFTVMRMDSPVHLGLEIVAVMFVGELVLSYFLAFIVSLMFEAPVVSLLRIVSPTKRKTT